MMFQRYILVILALAVCLVVATPVLVEVDSAAQRRDGSVTQTTYQASLSLVETSSPSYNLSELNGEATEGWSGSSVAGSKTNSIRFFDLLQAYRTWKSSSSSASLSSHSSGSSRRRIARRRHP